MLGPSACGEFMRTDFAPRIAPASSHFLPTSTPALRSASSAEARLVGALFEMCWTLVPVATIFATSLSSHFFPDGARRIELTPLEHRVVGDVAEQSREDVHVGDARERVLGELREVEHRDLAVLLLSSAASSRRRCRARSAAAAPGTDRLAPSGVPRRRHRARRRRRGLRPDALLKMKRIGQEHDASRASLSFSVHPAASIS